MPAAVTGSVGGAEDPGVGELASVVDLTGPEDPPVRVVGHRLDAEVEGAGAEHDVDVERGQDMGPAKRGGPVDRLGVADVVDELNDRSTKLLRPSGRHSAVRRRRA